MKVSVDYLFDIQVRTHTCKKDLKCIKCEKHCCELCSVTMVMQDFATVCSSCNKK